MRPHRTILVLLFLAFLAVTGYGASQGSVAPAAGPTASTSLQPASIPAACQADPSAGVHDPERLRVLNPCATFVGTVSRAPELNVSDGDVTFNAQPDPAYAFMLNNVNRAEGGLHVEIVPRDQPGCVVGQTITGPANNLGVCSGADVLFPPLGAHVRLTGVWVLDTWNGWNEIHPVWKVVIIPAHGPAPSPRHVYEARLAGSGTGGSNRSGQVKLTVAGARICWSFSKLRNVPSPTRSDIRRATKSAQGQLLVVLGSRFSTSGCTTVASRAAAAIVASPSAYVVTIYTSRYPRGAVRGRLQPMSG